MSRDEARTWKAVKYDSMLLERDALLAENERLREALRLVLPRLAHGVSCGSFNPTSEWAEKGSINFDNCSCEIAIVRAALAQATPTQKEKP